jgi:putative heme transporter
MTTSSEGDDDARATGGERAAVMRHRRTRAQTADEAGEAAARPDAIDPAQLSDLFSAPKWLRDLGFMMWLLVGVGAVLFGLVWLLGLTASITVPVILGCVCSAVAGPIVARLQRHGVPRAGGAAIVLLGLVVIGVLIVLLVLGGLASQSEEINKALNSASAKVQGWLKDAGIGTSDAAKTTDGTKSAVSGAGKTLVNGVADGISGLTSLFFTLSFAVFSTFFLLKDGPSMRRWINEHLGLPKPVAEVVTGETLRALRQYFLGVTIVAGFNAAVIGLGAWILGVPLAGTIAVVTFVGAYVPFIGAWVGGAFAVALALAGQGETAAIVMAVIVFLANGALQQIVQPIAFGATLGLNPLVVLIATISGGCLFGMIGLVLAAPLTSAGMHIAGRLAGQRAAKEDAVAEPEAPGAAVVGTPLTT